MADPVQNLHVRSKQLNLDGVYPSVRFSQLTFQPDDEWVNDLFIYKGCIVVYVQSGDEITFFDVEDDGNDELPDGCIPPIGASLARHGVWTGTPRTRTEANPNSHDWIEESLTPVNGGEIEFAIGPDKAIMFMANVFHKIKNTGATPATILVVSATGDDQCGGRPCFTYP